MNKISEKIREFQKNGVSDIQLVALVSDTSSEVLFYGEVDGVRYQSNNMVEEGKISSDLVDTFYEDITSIIKADGKFKADKMNIIKADAERSNVGYDEKKCRTFKIIKEWEKSLAYQ